MCPILEELTVFNAGLLNNWMTEYRNLESIDIQSLYSQIYRGERVFLFNITEEDCVSLRTTKEYSD